jgi:hypothetical protein
MPTGNPYWRGKLSTVDLLVLNSSDQLLFALKLYFSFYKTTILIRRSTVPEPSPSVSIPWCWNNHNGYSQLIQTRYPNKEVSCTEASPSVSVPWCQTNHYKHSQLCQTWYPNKEANCIQPSTLVSVPWCQTRHNKLSLQWQPTHITRKTCG